MKTPEEWAATIGRYPDKTAGEAAVKVIWNAQREAERKGAEDMRERCAKHLEKHWSGDFYDQGERIAPEIRSLPLPGDGEALLDVIKFPPLSDDDSVIPRT